MSKPAIRSYDELVAYRKNLQELLYLQKQLIIYDIDDIKEKVKPVARMAAKAKLLLTPSGDQSLPVKIISTAIGVLLRNIIGGKSGWITRTIVPFLVHNISTHFVAGNKEKVRKKFLTLFKKKKNKTN